MSIKSKLSGVSESERLSAATLTAVVIAAVLMLNVVIYVIAGAFGWYFYAGERDELTLTGNTDELFADAIANRKKVTVTFCYPKEDLEVHSTGMFVHRTALEFAERYPSLIEIKYVNIVTKLDAEGNRVDLSRFTKDMRGNDNVLARNSVIFECGRNYTVVTDAYTSAGFSGFFTLTPELEATSYNGEEYMAAMISWVLQDEHKTAYLVSGHGEQMDIAFGNLLVAAGYYVDKVNLKTDEVPEDCGLLVISNPVADFEKGSGIRTELERLETYVEKGGSIYVALDPYAKSLPVFESFLSSVGITLAVTELENGTTVRNIVRDSRNAITSDGFTLVSNFADSDLGSRIEDRVSKYSDDKVILRDAAALRLSENASPVLVSTEGSVCMADGKTVDTEGGYCIGAYSVVKSEFNEAHIFVMPSIFASVADALTTNGYANKDFYYALFEEAYGQTGLPYGCRAVLYDTSTLENLTMGAAKGYTAIIMAVPCLLAITGAVITVRRKNR